MEASASRSVCSPRLRLDPISIAHARDLFDGLQSSEIYRYIDDVPPVSVETLEERYRLLERRRSPDGTYLWLNWAVWAADANAYIGYVQATVPQDGDVEVAYVLFPQWWGMGLGREAVSLMIKLIREDYQAGRFHARAHRRNERSIHLLTSLGFRRYDSDQETSDELYALEICD